MHGTSSLQHALTNTTHDRRRPRPTIAHRAISFLGEGDVPICPNNHRFKDVWVLDSGILRCEHEDPDGGARCPWIGWMIGGGVNLFGEGSLALVVFVTLQEATEMRHEHMSGAQVLRYLGLRPDRRAEPTQGGR